MSDNINFGRYAREHNIKEHMIELKLVHSIKVAKYCKQIAENIFGNDEELIKLSSIIGLLHDISRFEQWSNYQTFIDKDSFDHGDYSVELLFEKEKILEYDIDSKWYPYIYIAIKNHNKLKIDETALQEYCKSQNINYNLANTLCLMIRDADKLDIARIFCANPTDMVISDSATKVGYTPEMMDFYKSKVLCDYRFRKTILDFAIGYLAFPFDFNFEKSNEIFAELSDDYIEATKTRFYHKLENDEDRSTLIECCEYLSQHYEKFKKLGE